MEVAISEDKGGWIQIVDSHDELTPKLAKDLSAVLSCKVICAHVYEVTGAGGWHIYESGTELSSVISEDFEDPYREVISALKKEGISTPLLCSER